MENIQEEDIVEKVVDVTTEEIEQDPLEVELNKVKNKDEGKTRLEKAIHRRKILDQEIKDLGGEQEIEVEDDDRPITRGELKRMEQERASKTALQTAEEIESEAERELVKYHLQNTIKSTGNPTKDVELARAIVNSVKNTQIAEEIQRKTEAKTHSSASSAPLKTENKVELTAEEVLMMQQFGMTPEEVRNPQPKFSR